MKEFIGFIAIIVTLLLLLLLAFGLLRVALITLPACIVAISVILLVLYLFRAQRIQYLNSRGVLSRILIVQFDGQKLNWEVDESQIELYAKAKLATFFCIILGMASIWLILSIVHNKGAFDNLTRLSSQANMIIGYIMSGMVVIITIIKAKPGETFKEAIWERGSYLVDRINTQLERIHELRSLETAIKSIAYQLKVSFPIDSNSGIQEFVNIHKNELLTDTTGLNNLIAENIKRAEEDRMHLEKANNHYRAAMKLYTIVAIEVNWTSSMPMIKEMEYDYEGLTSENLKSLLVDKKWDDFHDIVKEIMMDLQQLRELAIKYQEEGTTSYKKETEEEKAYRVMEISPHASNEDIKKAYRDLARNYHPDNAEQTTRGIKKLAEDRFKEINWAYNFLKEARNFW
ncbi:MAG: hypothetical protein DCC43_02790 [Candidatus Brocadia sp.]|jgi:hypothetical protein|nr:Chaperone protein DnaJ [Candidatus Brocadia fulgida]MCC6324535.1 J domain-containing protein [Candidatus Brocadia sp.]MCE7911073.1 J domain-containing protein [Candidatus Brocadia sp. AMX3]OQY98637.1 MAG: hypothetical protein B6D35_11460 [Candidatus Brocadia sp. UTAMX2]MDG5997007.1 J domain-containing protein [Candidatus Brocadia sp.]